MYFSIIFLLFGLFLGSSLLSQASGLEEIVPFEKRLSVQLLSTIQTIQTIQILQMMQPYLISLEIQLWSRLNLTIKRSINFLIIQFKLWEKDQKKPDRI